jgi:hypothetical protein
VAVQRFTDAHAIILSVKLRVKTRALHDTSDKNVHLTSSRRGEKINRVVVLQHPIGRYRFAIHGRAADQAVGDV